jgi:hypothetical protein
VTLTAVDAYELLYEAGLLYEWVRPEKREAALRSIESAQGALADLERRLQRLVGWLERNRAAEPHGGLTRAEVAPVAPVRSNR